MGCSHNFVYTQGYFVCTKCGKSSYGKNGNKNKNGKTGIVIGAAIALVILGVIFSLNSSEKILDKSIQELPEKLGDSVKSAQDKVSQITIPEVTIPIRNESGFDSKLVEDYIFEFTNEEREQRGLKKLISFTVIENIARNHSIDMSERNFYDHVNPDGQDPTDRARKSGYLCKKDFGTYYTQGLAENIAQSYTYSSYMTLGVKSSYNWIADEKTLAKQIVDGWMNSKGHRENILNPQYDRIGVGVEINSDETVYSTQNFC